MNRSKMISCIILMAMIMMLVPGLALGALDLTGVGIDVAAGKITGTTVAMEYSLDSTDGSNGTWAACSAGNTTATFAAGKVYVREAATTTNFQLVGTIAAAAAAPTSGVTYDVAAGTVSGLGATYEYSLNGGAYTTTAAGVSFVAGPVTVRTKATAAALPSAAETLGTIAAAAAAPALASDDTANTITGLDASYEYKIDGGAWTAGTVVGDFSGTKTVLVRVKATASALASANQTINFTTNVAPADKTDLNAKIGQVGALVANNYTAASWTTLTDALTAANTVNANAAATTAEVTTALNDLTSAMTNLVYNYSTVAAGNKDGATATVNATITNSRNLNTSVTVIFQLMDGAKPVQQVALTGDVQTGEVVTAIFNLPSATGSYTCRVLIWDSLTGQEVKAAAATANI